MKTVIKNDHVLFTTIRQELLTKPDLQRAKAKKDASLYTECTWSEPFVLYYDDECDEDSNNDSQL